MNRGQVTTLRRCTVATAVLALVFSLFIFPSFGGRDLDCRDVLVRQAHKISPLLRDQVARMAGDPASDAAVPVIIEVNPYFFARSARDNSGKTDYAVNALPLISSYTARLTGSQIKLLLDSEQVEYVTIDAAIRTTTSPSGP